MSNIKKNVFYSTFLTTANYIFPLITYPYVSRVLGVTNIGICNFVDSIINYYSLFAMMGMTTVAIREISSAKGDKNQLSSSFSSLLTLNLITTLIMIVALVVTTIFVPRLYENKELMFVGAFKLLFNTLLIEWLYKGLENFKYITIRSIIVRSVYVALVFLFIHKADDYLLYFILTTLITILNGAINFLHSRHFVKFSFHGLSFAPFLKSFFVLGVYSLLTSMYTTFNTAYLGFVGGNEQVGYYTTATKLHHILLGVFTAFTGVMLPRMTSLLSEGKREDFNIYFNKSIDVVFSFAFPIICLSVVFADQIVRLISGAGYENAIPCMQIIMPLIFIIGYDQILTIQILLPLKRDKDVLIISVIGAIVGVSANLILVPLYKSIGSSFVWLISEIIVLVLAQYFAMKQTGLHFRYKHFIKYILSAIPILVFLVVLHKCNPLGVYTVLIACTITFIYYGLLEFYVYKNLVITIGVKNVINKLTK